MSGMYGTNTKQRFGEQFNAEEVARQLAEIEAKHNRADEQQRELLSVWEAKANDPQRRSYEKADDELQARIHMVTVGDDQQSRMGEAKRQFEYEQRISDLRRERMGNIGQSAEEFEAEIRRVVDEELAEARRLRVEAGLPEPTAKQSLDEKMVDYRANLRQKSALDEALSAVKGQ